MDGKQIHIILNWKEKESNSKLLSKCFDFVSRAKGNGERMLGEGWGGMFWEEEEKGKEIYFFNYFF